MKIKISSSYTGVIPTGPYENARPSFSAEVEVEYNGEKPSDFIKMNQEALYKMCYDRFTSCVEQANIERINKERQDFRWYDGNPSVTSIINWDSDIAIPPHELQQYASQGNLYDAQAKHFIQTGEWSSVDKIDGTYTDIVIVKQGNLKLPINGWDFPAFLKKYPLEKMEVGKPLISKKHRFGGTSDIRVCYHDGKKTLADIKRTPDKWKHFKQCAAYVMLEEENGESPYEQLMLIPANTKTQQGFSKPVITTEIEQFKQAFLKDRETFKQRFGV